MADEYSEEFFKELRAGALRSAAEIVPLVLDLIQPRSVIDVGCGTGTWLTTFARHGVEDYLGVDAFTPAELLEIPRDRFVEADLTRPLELSRRFDLAVSLETAEHLPDSAAKSFIESLTRLAPAVLFSAAIPGQGGTRHLNEQWPEYWSRLFADNSFEPVDVLRPRVWNNERIEFWYAQNTILYVACSRRAAFPRLPPATEASGAPLAVVHPRLFSQRDWTLGEAVRGVAETRAQVESLNEALAAERKKVQWFGDEIEGLLQVAVEQRARAEQCLAKEAQYEAQAAEAHRQMEAARQEAQRSREEAARYSAEAQLHRAEAERYAAAVQNLEGEIARGRTEAEVLHTQLNCYRFTSEPRNMSLRAYLRALPQVVAGGLRRTVRLAMPWRRSS